MGATTCLVCGAREHEVSKMHSFPANLERSRVWQEKLGFKFTGESLKNRRICSKHFTRDAYIDLIAYKLRRDAVPIAFEGNSSTLASTSQVRPELLMDSMSSDGLVVSTSIDNVIVTSTPSSLTEDLTPETPSSSGVRPVAPSTPRTFRSKKNIFKNIGHLTKEEFTPRKRHLVKIIERKENHLRKVKSLCRRRQRDLKAVSNITESHVVRNLFQGMSSVTANFMISQIRSSKAKSAKGRRWTLEDKLMALCIFKKSPRCYRLLRKFFALPHKRTLLALLKKVPFEVGVNQHLFEHLNEKLPEGMDRCCILLFDEIDIQENVQYDVGSDRILGFQDFGSGIESQSTRKSANKALVFMLVGLTMNWKQPVAFYFTSNGCNSTNLQHCIFEILYAAKHQAKVDVVGTVCDMGVSNVKCLKELGVTIETPFFVFEDQRVFAMFDPPHLLKCTYSLFRKHNVILPCSIGNEAKSDMEARFGDIRRAHDIDKTNPYIFRTLHKIKTSHIQPVMKYAMKVSVAAQVLSHTTGAFLYSLVSLGVLEPRAVATALFTKQVDTLFDSFNGRSNNAPEGKKLRCAVKTDSPHHAYWPEAMQQVKSWSFKRLTKKGEMKTSKPPSQIGWMITLNAIQGIWQQINLRGASMLRPRSLNQDPLENLFGSIRYGCGCSDNPNVKQFIGSLKTQILNGLTNQAVAATNCEEDDNVLLSNLKSFLNISEDENDQTAQRTEEIIGETVSEKLTSDFSAHISTDNMNILSVAYVAGFILKSILKQIECELCNSLLVSNDLELHNVYISNKEWVDGKNCLIYPSEIFTSAVGQGVTILETYLDDFASQNKIMLKSETYLRSKINFNWLTCESHREMIAKFTIRGICRIGIPWWCKRQNEKIKEEKKEKRSSKRKINKFKHL